MTGARGGPGVKVFTSNDGTTIEFPDALVAAGRLQAERDAELLCRLLDILGEAEGSEHLRPPTKALSLGLALGLAAAIRISLWQTHGLSALFPEQSPPGHKLGSWLLRGPTAGPAADNRGRVVHRYYSAVWMSRMAWDGAAELGADVLLDRSSGLTDAELELLAEFLWAHRRA